MNDHPKRGGIYWVHFGEPRGTVIGETRPALVLSNDVNNQCAGTVTLAPITSTTPRKLYPFHCFVPSGIGGLKRDSLIKLEQITTVDKGIIGDLIGILPEQYIAMAVKALKIHLAISA